MYSRLVGYTPGNVLQSSRKATQRDKQCLLCGLVGDFEANISLKTTLCSPTNRDAQS